MGDDIPEDLAIPHQHRIHQEDPGHKIGSPAVNPPLQGRPAKLHREQKLEQDCQPERRNGQPGDREHAQDVIQHRIAIDRRDDAQRNADHGGE